MSYLNSELKNFDQASIKKTDSIRIGFFENIFYDYFKAQELSKIAHCVLNALHQVLALDFVDFCV